MLHGVSLRDLLLSDNTYVHSCVVRCKLDEVADPELAVDALVTLRRQLETGARFSYSVSACRPTAAAPNLVYAGSTVHSHLCSHGP